MKRIIGGGVALLVVLVAYPVLACGGLFCASVPITPQAPEPIDQNAERIIFEVDDGTVRAHVNIQYVGPADQFAWVVPVPTVPSLVTESESDLFEQLDSATRPEVMLPANEPCAFPSGGGGSSSCIGCSADETSASGGLNDSLPQDGDSPVTVYAQDYTDNYEYAVIGAENTQDLVDWLQDEDYNVSDNMTPVMDPYNMDGMVFLSLKLISDQPGSDIVPILMEYEAEQPTIPIQLTAVAAQPQMGVLVWIVSDRPYEPANYEFSRPITAEIVHDEDGVTSYFEWVARESAERGQFFSVEYVGFNPVTGVSFNGVSLDGSIVSRYYTRMSAEQMTADPTFAASNNLDLRVPAIIDLSANTTLFQCTTLVEERVPSLCAFNYCGEGGECTVVDGQVGCFCDAGQVAQLIGGPDGQDRVTCTPQVNDFGISAAAGGAGTPFDPCNDVDCGAGSCFLKAGFPTCECDEGAAACLEETGDMLCVSVPSTAPRFGPGAGNESRGAEASVRRIGEPLGTAYASGPWLPLFMLVSLLAGLGIRRRLVRA